MSTALKRLEPWRRRVAGRLRLNSSVRRRLGNITHLLAGNFVGSLIGLGAFALTARALGPLDYGILALIFSYTRAVERLLAFESWQPLIKFAAGLDDQAHANELKSLLKFGLLLDAAAAIVSFVVAVSVALLASHALGWSESTRHLVLIYCASLLFNMTGMATAVLRLAGHFRIIAYSNVVGSILRVALCAFAYWAGGGIMTFVIIWATMQALSSQAILAVALIDLRRRGVRGLLRAPVAGINRRFPGLWTFAWSSNLATTIRSSAYEFDTLLVGALADPASAGLYHIAKRMGRLAQQISAQVQAVLYPDFARLWASRAIGEFRRTAWQVDGMLGALGIVGFIVVFIIAEPLLAFVAGPAFVAAASLLSVQMIAVTFMMAGSGGRLALMSMGRQNEILKVVLAATAVFHLTALVMIPAVGAMGANFAHIAMGFVWTVGITLTLRRALRTLPPGVPGPEPASADAPPLRTVDPTAL